MRVIKITRQNLVESPLQPNLGRRPLGTVNIGIEYKPPTIGERYNLYDLKNNTCLSTSGVVEIIDENTFKTYNSVYKIENLILNDIYRSME